MPARPSQCHTLTSAGRLSRFRSHDLKSTGAKQVRDTEPAPCTLHPDVCVRRCADDKTIPTCFLPILPINEASVARVCSPLSKQEEALPLPHPGEQPQYSKYIWQPMLPCGAPEADRSAKQRQERRTRSVRLAYLRNPHRPLHFLPLRIPSCSLQTRS